MKQTRRLDNFLAHMMGVSRSDAKRLIGQRRVVVSGALARSPAQSISRQCVVTVDGVTVVWVDRLYLMLHKPVGVVSTRDDPVHPSFASLLPEPLASRVQPVGRLDVDTTGLLLLTDDGAWSHRVASPNRACEKEYRVTLSAPLSDEMAQALAAGVVLRDSDVPTAPAAVTRTPSPTVIHLTIIEGRYHQVKRMLAAVGNRVVALERLRCGSILLDPSLPAGEFRHLTSREIKSFEP